MPLALSETGTVSRTEVSLRSQRDPQRPDRVYPTIGDAASTLQADAGRMADRHGIAVVGNRAAGDAYECASPGAPRFAMTKFRPTTLSTTLVARPVLYDQLTKNAGRQDPGGMSGEARKAGPR